MEIVGAGREFYNRAKDLKAFDDTKAGVKGLVDVGVVKVPQIFVLPQDELDLEAAVVVSDESSSKFEIPVIDLEDLERNEHKRKEIINGVRCAAEKFGVFQLVNHGIPVTVMEEMLKGAGGFFEQDLEVKKQFYVRDDRTKSVQYNSNFDLYRTKAANWRDTVRFPDPLNTQDAPETCCKDIMLKYAKHVNNLGETLFELLSVALGLKANHLKGIDCHCLSVVYHYYPACPEPELTMGTSKHSDPSFLTVLLQNDVAGGLQYLHQDQWVDVHRIPGSLVVNIGNLLQLISNNKLKSAEHRVLAQRIGPRVSVVGFFRETYNGPEKLYGPIKELITEENPAIYKEITLREYKDHFLIKGLNGVSALDHFKL